jgi:hypothetical protein
MERARMTKEMSWEMVMMLNIASFANGVRRSEGGKMLVNNKNKPCRALGLTASNK